MPSLFGNGFWQQKELNWVELQLIRGPWDKWKLFRNLITIKLDNVWRCPTLGKCSLRTEPPKKIWKEFLKVLKWDSFNYCLYFLCNCSGTLLEGPSYMVLWPFVALSLRSCCWWTNMEFVLPARTTTSSLPCEVFWWCFLFFIYIFFFFHSWIHLPLFLLCFIWFDVILYKLMWVDFNVTHAFWGGYSPSNSHVRCSIKL